VNPARRPILAPPPPFALDDPPAVDFSVVIAARDAAAFVAAAVESALAQTVAPAEVIVSDDGSSDDLERALQPFGARVKLVRGEHGGPAAARNRALEVASGEFVAVLDADDAFLPERLAALRELAAARPDLDVLATDAVLESGGVEVGRFNRSTPFPVDDQRNAILRACFVCAPALRRSRVEAVGGYDEALRSGEDWDLLLRLVLAGCTAGLVDEPLYRYRLRAGSVTAERVAALLVRVQVLAKASARPGLSPAEERVLRESLFRHRRRLLRAEAEVAALEGARDRRRCALRLAAAPGAGLRERAEALRWSLSPGRLAQRAAANPAAAEHAPPWRRAAR
jgi:glycosyltransferase involved in cell wall biosynthesis